MPRPIKVIAADVVSNWSRVDPYAEPYLRNMFMVSALDDTYLGADGQTFVLRFLCNASTWRGEAARRVKAELKALLKN